MKQVLQNLKNGSTYICEVPAPMVGNADLLIATSRTLISAGTERMLVEFSKGNLLQKAKAQPEKVKQVLDKIRADGLLPTLEAVFSKLDEPLPLGYCNAGRVLEVGSGVKGYQPNDRVVSNGGHAEYVSVGPNLCAKIPDNVSDEEAAFTVLGSIGLQGIRLVAPSLGETVFVMGLGLIGLITVQILRANGCRVIGADFNSQRLELAEEFGCMAVDLSKGVDPVAFALANTNGRGVDAVLVTASTKSNEPMSQAAEMCRKRGRIVLVGVTGLELKRTDFYKKELTFQVSCSYGPGRYDSDYELKGIDYPVGYVRWTEQRNFEAILHLMSSGQLDVKSLVSHRFDISDAESAYKKLIEDSSALGLILEYPQGSKTQPESLEVSARTVTYTEAGAGICRVGLIGAGNYARATMLPVLKKANCVLVGVSSAGDVSGTIAARKFGISRATTDTDAIINDPNINTLFITTRHDSHALFFRKALQAGKHVFVEKPLAINLPDLKSVVSLIKEHGSGQHMMVGFNRRFSPHIVKMRELLSQRAGPACIEYNVNAGLIPSDSWTHDPKVGGGRIIGEGCHFIDILRFLINSPVISVFAQQVDNSGDNISEDKMSILLKYEDGSIGTVNYWANGTKAYMKEQIIAFADKKVLRMDNFRQTFGWGYKSFSKFKTSRQDKGHSAEFTMFCDLVAKGGKPLISFDEIIEATLTSFAAVESAKTNQPQQISAWRSRLYGEPASDINTVPRV